jgi:hypothetical protein
MGKRSSTSTPLAYVRKYSSPRLEDLTSSPKRSSKSILSFLYSLLADALVVVSHAGVDSKHTARSSLRFLCAVFLFFFSHCRRFVRSLSRLFLTLSEVRFTREPIFKTTYRISRPPVYALNIIIIKFPLIYNTEVERTPFGHLSMNALLLAAPCHSNILKH